MYHAQNFLYSLHILIFQSKISFYVWEESITKLDKYNKSYHNWVFIYKKENIFFIEYWNHYLNKYNKFVDFNNIIKIKLIIFVKYLVPMKIILNYSCGEYMFTFTFSLHMHSLNQIYFFLEIFIISSHKSLHIDCPNFKGS